MKNNKIVFISNGFSSKISGGDTHSNMMANYLVKEFTNIYFILPKDAFLNFFNSQIRVLRYKNIPFEKKFYKNNQILIFIYIYRIIASYFYLNKSKPNVVICSSHLFHDVIPMLFLNSKIVKVCYVHHILGQQKRIGFLGAVTIFLEKISFYILKFKKIKIITVSETVRDQLINKYNFNESEIFVSSNGISLDLINNVTNSETNKYDLVFCGRLHQSKGVFDLIQIMHEIKKYIPDVRCAIVGSGPEESALKNKISEYNLSSNIEMLGFVSETDKIKILKSSKLFILPSHEEGWGIVIAEALACGLPVILYELPDLISVWKKQVVWVECFDTDKFSNKVISILNNKNELSILSMKAYQYAKGLRWENVLEKELAILKQING